MSVNRELKEMAYGRALQRVRRQLPTGQRVGSRIIHQPAVNSLCELLDKTIGRPLGLLGAGLASFLGSLVYYLTAYGGYNFNIFLILLAGGYLAGLLLELIWSFLKSD